jgi:hypothetical protein
VDSSLLGRPSREEAKHGFESPRGLATFALHPLAGVVLVA